MKLRRAMAATAATAVIAPLALLSAPAAFASDDQPSSSATATATVTATESASDDTSTSPAPSSSESQSESAPESTPASTPPVSSSASTGTSESASAPAPSSSSPQASQSAEPTAEPTPCTDADVDPDSQLTVSVSGLPGKIVAGSGWHPFKLTAANHSDRALGQVQWLALVDNDSLSDDESEWLSTYAQLEYLNPETKAWESLADEIGDGMYFGETELGPKQTVDIRMRVNITAKAPAGDGYTVGLGGYVDQDKNCVHSAFDYYEFTVLKQGTPNDNPGDAKPKPGDGDKPAGGKEPQGGAKEIPPTGTLAETGSSSMLPTIGLVGGVAVVVGAGALFTVRRRKAGAGAQA
ncbi:LPXTG cell wall anchor domain-containing protein [Streptomyces sp. NPDC085995]|uniref:LPXTG cell wall anchor domain-containing protein n=1 Tax=Streptomyces sp. NPDC085995 TaxID=3154861 RepID=UPI0034314E34